MNPDISFSVIIPSFNRRKYLIDTLKCLERQSIHPNEAIVVDASLSEYRLAKADLDEFSFQLKYIEWDEIGNICKQRNHAIGIAESDYILFLDDDVEFDSDLLENFKKAFEETGADGISGNVATPKRPRGSPPLWHTGFLNEMDEPNIQTCDFIADTRIICTASFAVKKDALKAIGGFDLNQRGTLDDVEAGFRLSAAGYRIIHHPLPEVLHFQAPMSGARDSKNGPIWNLENQIYFQLKHRYKSRNALLVKVILSMFRPSRDWLKPINNLRRYLIMFKAISRATTLLAK